MARVKAILKFNSEYPKLGLRGRSFMEIYDFFLVLIKQTEL